MGNAGLLSRILNRRQPENPAPVAPASPPPPPPPPPGPIVLPPVPMADVISGGRSLHDGYQRGCSLMYSDMPARIEADPLYRAAIEASGGWSIMGGEKRMNLFLLLTQFIGRLDSQDVIEFGSYRGGNALFMAHILRQLHPGARVFALDTYAGMPVTDTTRDAHVAGDFGDSSQAALEARCDELGLSNLVIVPGLFQDTFPAIAAGGARFGLAHIDCDIYSAVKYAQDAVWPQMSRGGYLVYDDADTPTCIGATEAVEDLVIARQLHAEQVWPHWIYRVGL